jgi:hypothetical protein
MSCQTIKNDKFQIVILCLIILNVSTDNERSRIPCGLLHVDIDYIINS